uniref:Uncharacterized protein n=1 Tax=Oryza brachyantha TaxID=4533 RepID=J3LRP5_ORYBR
MFGGEDNKRHLLNDLHILDLERMMWEEVKTEKCGPPPRYDHSAAVYADQYLLIFGGSFHSTCFSDLYLLDLQTRHVRPALPHHLQRCRLLISTSFTNPAASMRCGPRWCPRPRTAARTASRFNYLFDLPFDCTANTIPLISSLHHLLLGFQHSFH